MKYVLHRVQEQNRKINECPYEIFIMIDGQKYIVDQFDADQKEESYERLMMLNIAMTP